MCTRPIVNDVYDQEVTSEASLSRFGAHSNGNQMSGSWTVTERSLHINELELLAVYLALQTFVKSDNINVLCHVDNTTALSYINNFGGCRSTNSHSIAKIIWQFCERKNIWLRATYINTKVNILADKLSRAQGDNSDFYFKRDLFLSICDAFGEPKIDYFASFRTKQVPRFWSWKPDPESLRTDSLTAKWENNFYAFPPFNLIGRVLRKIINEHVHGVVVVPNWPTQPWFPIFHRLRTSEIISFPVNTESLYDPYINRIHPLSRQVPLMAAVLSGEFFNNYNCQAK